MRRFAQWVSKDAWKLFFQLIAATTTLLLAVALGKELLKSAADEKIIVALVGCLFVSAFLTAYGRELGGRIKKIGPVEILEAQKTARALDDLHLLVRHDHLQLSSLGKLGKPDPLSPSQEFYFREGEQLLVHLYLSGTEPEDGAARDVFWELLYKIGSTALEQAGERLVRLAAKGELDWIGYFWLAYAQDEQQQWLEATLSNQEVLKQRPRLAPARYNLASSLLMIDRHEEACSHLENIDRQDDQADRVVQTVVAEDREMSDRIEGVRDPETRKRLRSAMKRLEGLLASA